MELEPGAVVLAVLAIVAAMFASGGFAVKIAEWLRSRDEKRTELRKAEVAAGVEHAKVAVERAVVDGKNLNDERETTGRFQLTLIDRIDMMTRELAGYAKRFSDLESANAECERHNADVMRKHGELSKAHVQLVYAHETLKNDHQQLKYHVERVEADNKLLRARVKKLDGAPGPTVEPEVVQNGAQAAQAAANKKRNP